MSAREDRSTKVRFSESGYHEFESARADRQPGRDAAQNP